jgi:heterotetrameric sarcosine oxidase delta subunit
MGFLIDCPNCGPRTVYEFKFAGEEKEKPGSESDLKSWRHYLYFNQNICGNQDEWWYHAGGCGAWIKVRRDTKTHQICQVSLPEKPKDK